MRRAAAAVLVALLAAPALAACQEQAPREPRVTTETRFLDQLSDAIGDLNRARDRVVRDANAIGTAAAALDDVDDVAVEGDRDAVRSRRGTAATAFGKAAPAARRLNTDIRRYSRAVSALRKAPMDGLDATQRGALDGVTTAAAAELAQLRGYATVVASVWPRYEKLDEQQRLWLMRASNGWYRDRQESAGAYVVMTDRDALARDRRSLAGADGRRLAAAREFDAEIERARGALAALLD